MARIFTIQFSYEGALHSALVSERVHPLATEYSLGMLDTTMDDLLRGRKVLALPTGELSFLQKEGLPQLLMDAVLKAIVPHRVGVTQ